MDLHCNNIVLGKGMTEHSDFVFANSLQPRDIFSQMNSYTDMPGKRTGILYGLRRTGKSILLHQWLLNLPYEERKKAAYISIEDEKFTDIKKDLNELRKNGYKYVVLDEITACKDMIECCASLSDNYCASGMKIFIAGTDSLSLSFARTNGLYDRNFTVHTTHIPYAEWKRITNYSIIDNYIKFGGLIHLQQIDKELKHSIPLKWTADELREYFTSSISNNILNSIRNYKDGENAGLLGSILNEKDMDAAVYGLFGQLTRHEFINRLRSIASIEETSLISALQSLILTESHTYDPTFMEHKFKLSDISRTRSAFRNKNDEIYDSLEKILEDVRSNAERLLRVKNSIGNYVNSSQFLDIVEYLRKLEVFAIRPALAFLPIQKTELDIRKYNDINDNLHTQNLVSQPGLRYAQADIMRKLIEDNALFKDLPEKNQNKIIETFQNGVFGIMQEDIILYETMQSCKKFEKIAPGDNNWLTYNVLPIKAYKAFFPNTASDTRDKEIDLIIEDKRDHKYFYIFEIKHSSQKSKNQYRWLKDENVAARLTRGNGTIKGKFILYNGESTIYDEILYINIDEYLEKLHYQGIRDVLDWLDKIQE